MEHVLGLDGGGTRTRVVLVNREGSIARYGETAGLDPTSVAQAPELLRWQLAGLGTPSAATLGLPYHGEIVEVTDWQTRIAAETLGPGARVLNDVALAHKGAFAGGNGVMILAGTGSMAWAEGPAGSVRVGGYGDRFGDEGSAYWIGRMALATASHEIDGRTPESGFAEALCARMGVEGEALIDWTYSQIEPRKAIAALARDVSALGQTGDAVARSILVSAGDELSLAGRVAGQRAGLGRPCRWSFSGGVFADPIICAAVRAKMETEAQPAMLPPVGGAVIDAAQRAGWTTSDKWIATLARNLIDRMTAGGGQASLERMIDDIGY